MTDVATEQDAGAPPAGAPGRLGQFLGGIPSHVTPETPGSIHEGGGLALADRQWPNPHPADLLRGSGGSSGLLHPA